MFTKSPATTLIEIQNIIYSPSLHNSDTPDIESTGLDSAAAVAGPPPVLRAHSSSSSVPVVHYSPALVAGRRRHFPWPAVVVVDLRLLPSVVAPGTVVAGNQERHSSWRTGQESGQIGAMVAEAVAVEGPSFVVVGELQERPFGRIGDWTGTVEEDHQKSSYAVVVGSCPIVVVGVELIVPEEGRYYYYWSLSSVEIEIVDQYSSSLDASPNTSSAAFVVVVAIGDEMEYY